MRRSRTLAGAAIIALGTAAVASSHGAQAADDPSSSRSDQAVRAAKTHPGSTGFGADQDLEAVDTMVDGNGTSHVRMHRTYQGLPVVGGDLVVHQSKSGTFQGSSQTLDQPLDLAVTPTVSRAAADARALAPSKVTEDIAGQAVDGSTLVVDATAASPRLAWKVLSGGRQSDGTPSRLASYVDATTGRVLRTEQEIVNVDGSGQTLYSGAVPLKVTQSRSSYQLKDPTRGGTYTTDLNNAEDSYVCQVLGSGCKAGTTFTSASTTFGTGTTGNRATVGADAQYGSNETWDYFKTVHGRNGIFGTGAGSFNRTHYGKNYVNAFWDGTKMTYGDGDGTNYGPLVSIDVAGHEMSHGVTENTAGSRTRASPVGSTKLPPTSSARWSSSTRTTPRTRATT